MSTRTYTIKGSILSRFSSVAISNLRVEAWDKDLLLNDLLGTAKLLLNEYMKHCSFIHRADRSAIEGALWGICTRFALGEF